jgi:hypothetical protein
MDYDLIKTWAADLVDAAKAFEACQQPSSIWQLREALDRWYYRVEEALDADPRSPYRKCAYSLQSSISRLLDACDQVCCKAGFD